MRRLPVYLLIDTSGSMRGEPIEAVKVGLESMISTLMQDPFALESAYLSIITFDAKVKQIFPLTPIDCVVIPELIPPESGPTHLGLALELLYNSILKEVHLSTIDQKGDWMPLVFIMTDGKPSDLQLYKFMCNKIKELRLGTLVACAAGMSAKIEPLRELTDTVYSLDTLDSSSFKQFFKWVSDSIVIGNRSVGISNDLTLPPPPPEVNIII